MTSLAMSMPARVSRGSNASVISNGANPISLRCPRQPASCASVHASNATPANDSQNPADNTDSEKLIGVKFADADPEAQKLARETVPRTERGCCDHIRKVEMFHSGEFDFFKNAGFHQVFFGDTVIGPRMPNLTYMLSFGDSAELEAKWKVFANDPAWKKLSSDPKYAFESIVSNITNLILSPLSASQI